MTDRSPSRRTEACVRFLPSDRVRHVRDSLTIFALAREADVAIYNTCNGVGTCGKCLVFVKGPVSEPTDTERRFLSEEQLKDGWRLACQTWPRGEVEVTVPSYGPQQILTGGVRARFRLAPPVVKRVFKLTPPSLEDQTGDYARACRELGIAAEDTVGLEVLRSLAGALRPEWQATAVLCDGRLTGIEPGDTTASLLGVAFDIGTTTLVGYLRDLWTGEELAVASDLNPQVSYGADVISRIEYAINEPNGLKTLHTQVCNRLNRMIGELCDEAGADRRQVYAVSVAGNSVMQHLFLGIDPRNIAFAPYIPVVQEGLSLPPGQARMDINPAGRVYVMPAVASYVGGDIVADILATRLWRRKGTSLLVDIGTNGEIVLCVNGDIVACAAPAGPCFEGANISSGMRAAEGAITSVRLTPDGDFCIETIGGARARGFCGSGLVDAVAALLESGLVDETGRLLPADELPDTVPAPVAARLRERDGAQEVVFGDRHQGEVALTQADIRELQNAKGSIAAGIQVLCDRNGVDPAGLGVVLLAGAFGNFVRPSSARRIGLLPAVPLNRIRSVGNAAGVGAQMALLSHAERRQAQRLRSRVRYVELSGSPDFRDAYMDAMFFPTG
ncbi:MAG: ferredoxin [Armatimonadota bacterium]|nr:MAG: ferredoxin [Armatimonadota bacterium]